MGRLTVPRSADFTQVNFGGSTSLLQKRRALVLRDTNTSTTQNRILTVTEPATPYTLTVGVKFLCTPRDFIGWFIGWRKSSTAEIRAWLQWHTNSAIAHRMHRRCTIANNTANTTNATDTVWIQDVDWLRITDDGTTRRFWVSRNGQDWAELSSELTSAFISDADQLVVGMQVNHSTAADVQVLSIEHFRIDSEVLDADEFAAADIDCEQWIDTVPTNAQVGTTYTLALADASRLVTLSNASAITLTVPPNSSTPFSIGTQILLAQIGAGKVTVAQGSGVTVRKPGGFGFRAQWGQAALLKVGTDEWYLIGDLDAV